MKLSVYIDNSYLFDLRTLLAFESLSLPPQAAPQMAAPVTAAAPTEAGIMNGATGALQHPDFSSNAFCGSLSDGG
jgi:hypothetical protein